MRAHLHVTFHGVHCVCAAIAAHSGHFMHFAIVRSLRLLRVERSYHRTKTIVMASFLCIDVRY